MADDDKPKPFAPLGSDLPMSVRRSTPIPEDRRQSHALEHIAAVADRIDEKLERLVKAIEALRPPQT